MAPSDGSDIQDPFNGDEMCPNMSDSDAEINVELVRSLQTLAGEIPAGDDETADGSEDSNDDTHSSSKVDVVLSGDEGGDSKSLSELLQCMTLM